MTNTAMIQCSQRATRLYFSCEVIRISFFNETVISALLVRYVCPCGADQEIDLVLTTLQTFQNNMLSVEACRDKDDDADPVDLHPCRSEEHTSELQSLMRISYAVFCLKNKTKI